VQLLVNNAGTINQIKMTAKILRHFIPLMIEKKHGILMKLDTLNGIDLLEWHNFVIVNEKSRAVFECKRGTR
jgi:hypothetical protein